VPALSLEEGDGVALILRLIALQRSVYPVIQEHVAGPHGECHYKHKEEDPTNVLLRDLNTHSTSLDTLSGNTGIAQSFPTGEEGDQVIEAGAATFHALPDPTTAPGQPVGGPAVSLMPSA
jgi:hypothetical protein